MDTSVERRSTVFHFPFLKSVTEIAFTMSTSITIFNVFQTVQKSIYLAPLSKSAPKHVARSNSSGDERPLPFFRPSSFEFSLFRIWVSVLSWPFPSWNSPPRYFHPSLIRTYIARRSFVRSRTVLTYDLGTCTVYAPTQRTNETRPSPQPHPAQGHRKTRKRKHSWW